MTSFDLKYRNSARKGKFVPIEGTPFVVGRSKECKLVLPTTDVSRKHCAFINKDGRVFLQDLKSRNGTKVNGQKLESGTACELANLDKVQIGKWKFRFLVGQAEARSGDQVVNDLTTENPLDVLAQIDELASTIDFSSSGPAMSNELSEFAKAVGSGDADAVVEEGVQKTREVESEDHAAASNPSVDAEQSENANDHGESAKPDEEEPDKEEPDEKDDKRVPEHLRGMLRKEQAADSQGAAEAALRNMFGG